MSRNNSECYRFIFNEDACKMSCSLQQSWNLKVFFNLLSSVVGKVERILKQWKERGGKTCKD